MTFTKANAIDIFERNLQRTEMLITAMEKIKAFNQIYQMKQTNMNEYLTIKSIQDKELIRIEESCGEHALISLVTLFETFCKELVQELLADYPTYFISRQSEYSDIINALIQSDEYSTFEDIERKFKLKNRFDYYRFMQSYSINLLSDEDGKIIDYLYSRRNYYVHNVGRIDAKLDAKLLKTPSPFPNTVISTEVKRLRTKLKRILFGSYKRVIATVSAG